LNDAVKSKDSSDPGARLKVGALSLTAVIRRVVACGASTANCSSRDERAHRRQGAENEGHFCLQAKS
jgi:hypothetical protein